MTATESTRLSMQTSDASERGFTLVELMVVVAIIALLAATVIPSFVHARAQASVSETEANMKQIATALELYYDDKQTYPPGSAVVNPTLFGGANNPYLNATPQNALQRADYNYADSPAAGGVPEYYTLTDPGIYDPSTLTLITAGKGGLQKCTTCKTINYSPQDGFYGT